jgi:hypothetical protein
MFLPWGYATLVACFFIECGFHSKHYPADEVGSTACAAREIDRTIERELILTGLR